MEKWLFNPQNHFDHLIVVWWAKYTLLEALQMEDEGWKAIFDEFLLQEDNVKTLLWEDYKNLKDFLNEGYSFEEFIRFRNMQHQMPPSAAEYEHDLSTMNNDGKWLTEEEDEARFVQKSKETLPILLEIMGIENKKE